MRKLFTALCVIGFALFGVTDWQDASAGGVNDICPFVQRFEVKNRPQQIVSGDLAFIKELAGFGDSTIEKLQANLPIQSRQQLEAINGIGNGKLSFTLRIFFNLGGAEPCTK